MEKKRNKQTCKHKRTNRVNKKTRRIREETDDEKVYWTINLIILLIVRFLSF